MGSTVSFQCPNFHFSETLSAELSLSAQELLSNQRIRTGGTGMNLVIHQVSQFEEIHISYSNRAVERFARTPVINRHFTVTAEACLLQCIHNINFGCTVKYRRSYMPAHCFSSKTKVNLQHLSDIHTGRNAQGVQADFKGCTVGQEGHILFWKHSGNNTLVSMTACHFVTYGDFSLLCHIDAYQLVDSGRQFITIFPGKHFNINNNTAFTMRNL